MRAGWLPNRSSAHRRPPLPPQTGSTGDQILVNQIKTPATLDSEVVERANANSFENLALSIKSKLEDLTVDRMERNEDFVARYLNDPQFQAVAFPLIARQIFDTIRGK